MDQLTLPKLPVTNPNCAQQTELAAGIAEIASEVYALCLQGAQIKLDFSGGFGVRLVIKGPAHKYIMVNRLIPGGRVRPEPYKHHGDAFASYNVFDDVLFEDEDYDKALFQLSVWRVRLSTVRHHIQLFKCRKPTPLKVLN